jgi:undecaprenyl diphosphate synthase
MQTTNKDIPKHVTIIMDGNGRWAKQRKKSRLAGHRAGAESVRKVIKAAAERGVEVLSLFAFSTENWSRPKEEVSGLMKLFLKALQDEAKGLVKNNIQLHFIGDLAKLSSKLRQQIAKTEGLTRENTGLKLVIAVNYGGRWDIAQAMQQMLEQKISVKEVTPELLAKCLVTSDLPDPDLLIRTSGEQRISNFFLWQLAYAELYFTETLWPDFDEDSFAQALQAYAQRKRRFGAL